MQENINRRLKGDGSVYQRKSDGRWVGRYKDEFMPRAKYVYGKTEVEAQRKLIAMRRDAIRGLGGNKKVLFNDYFERWLFQYKKNVIRPTSLDKYEETYTAFIAPYFKGRQLCSITAAEIQMLLDESVEETSYSRAEKIISLMKMCFQHACTMGDVQSAKNPMLYVKLPDETSYRDRRVIVVLNNEQVKQLEIGAYKRSASSGNLVYKYGPLLVFLANTGIRRGELLALRWTDVDFEKRILHIRKSLVRVRAFYEDNFKHKYKYMYVEQAPKTKNSIRDVPLNQKAIDALRIYKENCAQTNSLHTHIARTKEGLPLKPPTFDHAIKKVFESSGLKVERFSLHCFRHTFATRLIKAHVDIQQVSLWMGHSSPRTTMEVYQHLLDEEKKAALEILESL